MVSLYFENYIESDGSFTLFHQFSEAANKSSGSVTLQSFFPTSLVQNHQYLNFISKKKGGLLPFCNLNYLQFFQCCHPLKEENCVSITI